MTDTNDHDNDTPGQQDQPGERAPGEFSEATEAPQGPTEAGELSEASEGPPSPSEADLQDANPREAAVEARVPDGIRPPEPPRRTGVFVHPDDLREYVGGLLRSMLGGYEADAFGNFTFVHEDTRIFITVGSSPVGPQVGVFSVTNVEVDLSPQLAGFLLTTNHQLGFGAFSYDPENRAVWLRHSLLGTTLDAPELQTAVAAVANTAHQANKAIAQRFGGSSVDPERTPDEASPRPPSTEDTPDLANPTGYLEFRPR